MKFPGSSNQTIPAPTTAVRVVEKAAHASARPPFDTVTITLHWLTAVVVLTLVGSGLLYGLVEDRPWGGELLAFHRSLGVVIWTITMLRILWRITGARSPEFPTSMTPMHQLGARLSEYALYALLLIQPATGVAQTILRGHPFKLFVWSIPSFAARNLALTGLFSKIHEIGAWFLVALAGLHAAAALVHHFILRDDVLQTMAPVFRRRVVRVAGLGRKLQQPARAVDITARDY